MKILKESDLEIGDILIFEDYDFNNDELINNFNESGFKGAFYYLLHYLIAWFDPGKEGKNYKNIYHAAIWGNVDINRDNNSTPLLKNCVVQAGTNGIGYATLKETLTHKTVMNVYVCRLKEKTSYFETDINKSIRDFYKEKGYYSFKTAWLLAIICSMRYTKGQVFRLLEKYLHSKIAAKYVVKMILDSINEYSNHNQRKMVACSPLVGMMYKNAGYELPVNVFELWQDNKFPHPLFDLKNLEEKLPLTSYNENDEWPTIKETIVTPRQLMESPAVEMIGILKHLKK